jgi:hypothetical protein
MYSLRPSGSAVPLARLALISLCQTLFAIDGFAQAPAKDFKLVPQTREFSSEYTFRGLVTQTLSLKMRCDAFSNQEAQEIAKNTYMSSGLGRELPSAAISCVLKKIDFRLNDVEQVIPENAIPPILNGPDPATVGVRVVPPHAQKGQGYEVELKFEANALSGSGGRGVSLRFEKNRLKSAKMQMFDREIQRYRDFEYHVPLTPQVGPPRDIDSLACDDAKRKNSPVTWAAYLKEFPGGKCADTVRKARGRTTK